MFKNNFTELKSFEILSLKIASAQSTKFQFTTFKKLNETVVIDALLSQITLLFKSKIIKVKKIRIYKNQSENKHQR